MAGMWDSSPRHPSCPGTRTVSPTPTSTTASRGVTERVSLGLAGTQALGGDTRSLSLSADGRFVAMASSATNLVLNDTNGVQDVFVRDRLTGTTTRVSVPTSFGQAAGASGYNLISADGRYVVFTSTASNLVAGDTNGHAGCLSP